MILSFKTAFLARDQGYNFEQLPTQARLNSWLFQEHGTFVEVLLERTYFWTRVKQKETVHINYLQFPPPEEAWEEGLQLALSKI